MGGGGTETTTQTNAPSNPEVNPTLTALLQGTRSKFYSGEAAGNPAALTQGWGSQLSAASNPDYARGVSGSTRELADIASGSRFGMDDPGYAALRQGAIDDTTRSINSSNLTDGRFGSTVHGEALGRGVSSTIAGLDYANLQNDQQRQMQAISALPSAFAAGQAPGSVQAAVGQQQQQAPWWNLGQASSVLSGTSGAGGSTSTMTQPGAPWWQAPAAIGGTLASAFF